MPALLVRAAVPADAPAIAAIYNEGIADRIATFETRERTADEVHAWLGDGFPFLVATANDQVVGWARVAPYSDRCVYAGVGEHGVHVARAARGHGVGRRLLDELCLPRRPPACTS
jgi:L-amino acid N-acyltransferase YncA